MTKNIASLSAVPLWAYTFGEVLSRSTFSLQDNPIFFTSCHTLRGAVLTNKVQNGPVFTLQKEVVTEVK